MTAERIQVLPDCSENSHYTRKYAVRHAWAGIRAPADGRGDGSHE